MTDNTLKGFLEHLDELRKRLIYSIIILFVGFIACYIYHKEIFHILAQPLISIDPDKYSSIFAFHKLTEPFFTYLRLSFYVGIFVSSPFLIHQLWLFIAPALYKEEKKYAIPFIFFSSLLFLCGGYFGYQVALKYMVAFFLGEASGLTPVLTMDNYISLSTKVILGMGVVFELPILILFLSLMGLIDHKFLIKNFKYAFLIVFIIAAVITPSGDPVTQTIFAAPMVVLYIVGIGIAYIFGKEKTE
jgi:sec-independent protein translocase protein TatC